jgi:hypothetical protein
MPATCFASCSPLRAMYADSPLVKRRVLERRAYGTALTTSSTTDAGGVEARPSAAAEALVLIETQISACGQCHAARSEGERHAPPSWQGRCAAASSDAHRLETSVNWMSGWLASHAAKARERACSTSEQPTMATPQNCSRALGSRASHSAGSSAHVIEPPMPSAPALGAPHSQPRERKAFDVERPYVARDRSLIDAPKRACEVEIHACATHGSRATRSRWMQRTMEVPRPAHKTPAAEADTRSAR